MSRTDRGIPFAWKGAAQYGSGFFHDSDIMVARPTVDLGMLGSIEPALTTGQLVLSTS